MKFEKVSFDSFRKDMLKYGFVEELVDKAYKDIVIPTRKTRFSAGYDFVTPVDFSLKPHEQITIPTGIKVYFKPEEAKMWHLELYIRSSVGITRGVVMSNQTGVIDADYYNNPDNEGDMLIALRNVSENEVKFSAGDRIIQGVFAIHGVVSDDSADGVRKGGVGSTDE